jgi:hypothetical protein
MAHTVYKNKTKQTVPSVTTVISNNLGWNKQMLIAWSKKIALTQGRDSDDVVKEAGDIGTLTHFLIENKIKSQLPDISKYSKEHLKQAKNGYLAFCDWEMLWKPEKYAYSEVKLVSEKYQFGGTIDIIALKENHYHILDIKTSNHIHPEMVIQIAAYKKLFEENFDEQIKSCSIIKVEKGKREYSFFTATDNELDASWSVFQSLLELNQLKSKISCFGKNKVHL